MRRIFWLVAGITVGVLAFRKLQQTAEKMSATNVGRSLGSALTELAESASDFIADIRAAMHEQEATLREGAGLDGEIVAGRGPSEPAPQEAREVRPA